MNRNYLVDGLIIGSMIGLGAIGVTLTYSILRFANFAHGEFLTWGAYFAARGLGALGFAIGSDISKIAPFSFGWPLAIAALIARHLTGLLALALDRMLFARLRAKAPPSSWSWPASARRWRCAACCEFFFTSQPRYFSRDIRWRSRSCRACG